MKLIDNWVQHLWKAWSIRLAGIAGVVGAYFFMFPAELARVTAMVPERYRDAFGVLAGLFIFATASGSKLLAQKNLTPPPGDDEGAQP